MSETPNLEKVNLFASWKASVTKKEKPKVEAPEVLQELEKLVPMAVRIQRQLKEHGVLAIVAGGVAADLLGKSLPDHSTRFHKDVDLLVPRHQLNSVDDAMVLAGLKEVKKEESRDASTDNLRIFSDGTNGVDVMGYHATNQPNTGDFPLLSWGKIDQHRAPIVINTKPVAVSHGEETVEVLEPKSLLKMKSSRGLFHEGNDKRDLDLLHRLIESK